MPQYSASLILIKHQDSRRPASWKDPEGTAIQARTRDEAVATLRGFLQTLSTVQNDPVQLHAMFAALAEQHSDCGSARKGGDLGQFDPGQMMACVRPWRDERTATPLTRGFAAASRSYRSRVFIAKQTFTKNGAWRLAELAPILAPRRPFEAATEALPVGGLSGVVDTDSGAPPETQSQRTRPHRTT